MTTGQVGQTWTTAKPQAAHAYLHEPIMRLAGPISPETRVLDLGCGNGYWASEFAKHGATVVGVDSSESGIDYARHSYPGIRFECMEAGPDALAELGEDPFDVVVCAEVIEHVYDPPALADACREALRPGGVLVLSTPYHGWLKNVTVAVTGKHDHHHMTHVVGGHIKFFSNPALTDLLTEAGFTDLEFAGAGRMPRMWKSTVVRATRS